MSTSERFVLFADMLGFADLVMNNPDSIRLLSPRLGAASKDEQDAVKRGDQLIIKTRAFYKAVREQLEGHLRRDVKAIVFSDSVFVTLYTLPDILGFARGLMWRLMAAGIPARMGIGHGTFWTLRLNLDFAGEAAVQNSQFLGTGVVDAYRTERSVKGVVIALSKSINPFEAELVAGEILKFDRPMKNAYAIANIVFQREPASARTVKNRNARHADAKGALTKMKAAAAVDFHCYYDFSLERLDKMRDAWKP
jgi:hypothetical protein